MLELHANERSARRRSSVVWKVGPLEFQALDHTMMYFHLEADVVLGVEHKIKAWSLRPHPLVSLQRLATTMRKG